MFDSPYWQKILAAEKVVIYGMGKEGLSTWRFFRCLAPQKKLYLVDDNLKTFSQLPLECQKDRFLTLVKEKKEAQKVLSRAEVVIKSPGICERKNLFLLKAKEKGALITSNLNIFLSFKVGKSLGITGTKGKSTTAYLLYQLLKSSFSNVFLAGNIGQPALDILRNFCQKRRVPQQPIFVLELSSYQLENLQFPLFAALFVSFFPDHLDYHNGQKNYFSAKTNIFSGAKIIIYNQKFSLIKNYLAKKKLKAIGYNNEKNYFHQNDFYLEGRRYLTLPAKSLLKGEHYKSDFLGSLLLAKNLKAKKKNLVAATKKLKLLPHRLEKVGIFQQISFYDDAAATTPQSTEEALKSFSAPLGTLILGGLDRGYDFSSLALAIKEKKPLNLIFFPETGEKIISALKKIWPNIQQEVKIFWVKDMSQAVKLAFQHTPPKSICLLSPGAPSYLSFANFVERGEIYQKEVKKRGKNLTKNK